MKLANTARWADKTKLYDAYQPNKLVMHAQISSYIDNQMDGAISKRRVISFSPTQKIPPRRVVTYTGERWIVGDTLVDHWRGKAIRVAAASKKVTGSYQILSGAEAALGSEGVEAFGQLLYLKDTVNTTDTSTYSPQFEVYFAAGEPVSQGRFIKVPTGYVHVRSLYPVLDGFLCAISDDIGEARKAVELKSKGTYNSASDSWPETSTAFYGMLVDFYKLYGKDTPLTYNQVTGDMSLIMAKASATPKAGDNLIVDLVSWKVMQVYEHETNSYRLHLRRST